MGDRTFSAEDVIRIYEDFLTSSEQETVDEFFAVEPEEPVAPVRDNFFIELEIIAESNRAARVPLPGLFGLALRFFPFAATLVDTVLFNLTRTAFLLQQLLNEEEVDA